MLSECKKWLFSASLAALILSAFSMMPTTMPTTPFSPMKLGVASSAVHSASEPSAQPSAMPLQHMEALARQVAWHWLDSAKAALRIKNV